ncbi:MAG: hypothetical protein ACI8W7_001289 [Gammaproteobacteria bacterium]
MNSEKQQWIMRLLLVGIAIVGPSMLTIQLVRAAGAPAQQLRGSIVSSTLMLAQNTAGNLQRAAINSKLSTSPITAILYTNGESEVSWNGSEFAVNNGSYAYVGGETIQMAAASIGLLRLSNGDSVYICGPSTVSLSRAPHVLDITHGSARFFVKEENNFTVRANGVDISPAAGTRDGVTEGEVSALTDGASVVYELVGKLQINTDGANAPAPPAGSSANIYDVAPASQAIGPRRVSVQSIPAAAMPASLHSGASARAAFLCQGEELRRTVNELARLLIAAVESDEAAAAEADLAAAVIAPEAAPTDALTADPQAPQETAQPAQEPSQQSDQPPLGVADAPPDAPDVLTPPVAPPEAPPLALAQPEAPDPFDPNVLPPPAAGEPTDPIVIVAPPVVPSSGSGGGGIASPS